MLCLLNGVHNSFPFPVMFAKLPLSAAVFVRVAAYERPHHLDLTTLIFDIHPSPGSMNGSTMAHLLCPGGKVTYSCFTTALLLSTRSCPRVWSLTSICQSSVAARPGMSTAINAAAYWTSHPALSAPRQSRHSAQPCSSLRRITASTRHFGPHLVVG